MTITFTGTCAYNDHGVPSQWRVTTMDGDSWGICHGHLQESLKHMAGSAPLTVEPVFGTWPREHTPTGEEQPFGIPVMLDVAAPDRETAARWVSEGMRTSSVIQNTQGVQSWWLIESTDRHADDSDNLTGTVVFDTHMFDRAPEVVLLWNVGTFEGMQCPHGDHLVKELIEVDQSTRHNTAEPEWDAGAGPDGTLVLIYHTGQTDHQHQGYLCGECMQAVRLPDKGVEVSEVWS